MYRPQSLEVSNRSSLRYTYKGTIPDLGSGKRNKNELEQERYVNRNLCTRGSYTQGNDCYNRSNKKTNLDYHISNMMRQGYGGRTVGGLCQSQSFSSGPHASYHRSGCVSGDTQSCVTMANHTSRLSACMYMSPPSPHWATVGNIMSVRRSTSMPGSRPQSVTLAGHNPTPPGPIPSLVTRSTVNSTSIKKKYGPFQCLKHQFRRSGHKDTDGGNQRSVTQLTPVTAEQTMKTSKSVFKKKPITISNNVTNSSSKSRGIRKSISLLFSKSSRSSKSDPSIMDKTQTTDRHSQNSCQATNISSSATRRNRSYESMLESSDVKIRANDTDKCCSYSDVQESSSLSSTSSINKTTIAVSVDVILCQRSPSESSLAGSSSVSSSKTASCHRNSNYQTNDSGWKTVIGNVCRSNSKDSAIANSTLSGDGMINQSKRISLTSTVSRTSDLTTTSEDFHDSSYSSFNDLQTNSSQFSYTKPRLLSTVCNLKPIKVTCNTVESANSSDISPSSDSSTETLRPLSCLHRQRYMTDKNYRSSHSNLTTNQSGTSDLKYVQRSHSWSILSLKPVLLTQQRNPSSSNYANTKPNYPKLKLSYIQHSHLNSSPLLSQYSRLYSLRSAAAVIKDHNRRLLSPAPMSPNKYTSVTCPLKIVRAHHT